mmetsp:Transcript_15156/g.45932  ORF Transcript_15156/g.45932 Transcript_15156/m.45932 type:complete len:223 (-) Transcript_15156:868-1536(-)
MHRNSSLACARKQRGRRQDSSEEDNRDDVSSQGRQAGEDVEGGEAGGGADGGEGDAAAEDVGGEAEGGRQREKDDVRCRARQRQRLGAPVGGRFVGRRCRDGGGRDAFAGAEENGGGREGVGFRRHTDGEVSQGAHDQTGSDDGGAAELVREVARHGPADAPQSGHAREKTADFQRPVAARRRAVQRKHGQRHRIIRRQRRVREDCRPLPRALQQLPRRTLV